MVMASSLNFPAANSIQTCTASPSGFVSKLAFNGSALVFSSCVLTSTGMNLIPDNSGTILLTGTTGSSLPTMNPLQGTFGGGSGDAFLVKLSEQFLKKRRAQVTSQ